MELAAGGGGCPEDAEGRSSSPLIIRQQASGFGRRALFVASDVHVCHRSQEAQQLLAEAHK